MTNTQSIHRYIGNSCELSIIVKKSNVKENGLDFGPGRHVQNIRNCDLFIEDYNFFIYLDVQLYKFQSSQRFDIKNVKNVRINYNTKEHCIQLSLPCLPEDGGKELECKRPIDLWKLKKITDQCCICIDNSQELLSPESNFDYGFASKFRGSIKHFECDLEVITRIPNPDKVSPIQRTIDREIDEMKNFCRDQYKLNFIKLQIPHGHTNPLNFSIDFQDSILTPEEQCLLHNLTCKPEFMEMPDEYDIMEIDCGLVSILLAICYDVKFTANEANCVSAWTRSVLSPTLTYFETITSLREVVISFMRSCLTYPLCRNYELARECVEECINALRSNTTWIIKQLLISRDLFETNERTVFNYYYIDDYIRYLRNPVICPAAHLKMLAHNLKNVLLDIFKKDLGLCLQELETELFKELIADTNVASSEDQNTYIGIEDDNDGDTTDDMNTDGCESDPYNSLDSEGDNTSSETEDDSVIEQSMDKLKL